MKCRALRWANETVDSAVTKFTFPPLMDKSMDPSTGRLPSAVKELPMQLKSATPVPPESVRSFSMPLPLFFAQFLANLARFWCEVLGITARTEARAAESCGAAPLVPQLMPSLNTAGNHKHPELTPWQLLELEWRVYTFESKLYVETKMRLFAAIASLMSFFGCRSKSRTNLCCQCGCSSNGLSAKGYWRC